MTEFMAPFSSRLAIGTAALLGPRSRAEALRLLETAYDSGITHVDTARAYASGDAESVVGDFLRRHDGYVTFTTKFGIAPMGGVVRRAAIRRGARRLMATSPRVRRLLGHTSARLSHRSMFAPADARESIITSLRTLNLDRIDVLLLHDASPADCGDGLLELLTALRSDGTIGAFGAGTSAEHARAILRDRPEFADVLQLPVGATWPAAEGGVRDRTVVTHGALAPHRGLLAALSGDPHLHERWNRTLDVDVLEPCVLAGLLLAQAVERNGCGPVLFSTTREDRVRTNVDMLDGPLADPERLRMFDALVRALPSATPRRVRPP